MGKEEGIKRVFENAVPWNDRAISMLAVFAYQSKGEFTSDDFRAYADHRGLGQPHHENAWGALMSMATRQHVICATGKVAPSTREKAHGRLIRTWTRT